MKISTNANWGLQLQQRLLLIPENVLRLHDKKLHFIFLKFDLCIYFVIVCALQLGQDQLEYKSFFKGLLGFNRPFIFIFSELVDKKFLLLERILLLLIPYNIQIRVVLQSLGQDGFAGVDFCQAGRVKVL